MNLEQEFSAERLAKYQLWAGGDRDKTYALYALNLALSGAFYTSLHVLEITLRNGIHNRMVSLHGAGWFNQTNVITNGYWQKKVVEANRKFQGQATDGQIVAELTFGFWTALFNKNNNRLWGHDLRPVFDMNASLQRKNIAKRLADIKSLRNRIAHHESIVQLDLDILDREIKEIIGWLSPDALQWCNTQCLFSSVYPSQPIIIGGFVNPKISL